MNATRRLALCLLSSLTMGLAMAEDAPPPNTDDMIQALKHPKTRGLRNLVVNPSEEAAADSAKPGPAPIGNKKEQPAPPVAAMPAPSLALTINFESNSYKVSPSSEPTLANLARALRSSELAGSKFLIEGHTDAKGSAAYNRKLSQLRAEQVRHDLIAKGVESKRLIARGVGSAHPANPNDLMAAENRRVRIVNIDQN